MRGRKRKEKKEKKEEGRFFFLSIEESRENPNLPLLFRFSLSLLLPLNRTLDAAAMPKQLQLQSMMMLLERRRNVWRASKESRESQSMDALFANASFLNRPPMPPFKEEESAPLDPPFSPRRRSELCRA